MKKAGHTTALFIFLLITVALYAFFIPPAHYIHIGIMILLIALSGMQGVAAFGGDRTIQYLFSVFIVIFLTLQTTIGFNVINTILLASFIIGIGIFMKEK